MTTILWFDSAIAARLCLVLFHSLWQVAAIAVALAVIDQFLHRRTVTLRYNLHVVGLVLSVAAVAVTFVVVDVPQRTSPSMTNAVAAPSLEDAPADRSSPRGATPQSKSAASLTLSRSDRVASPMSPRSAAEKSTWVQYAPAVASVYLLCVVAMLARLALGATRAHRLCAAAEPITSGPLAEALARLAAAWSFRVLPALARSEEVFVPQIIGFLKPTILLPFSAATGLHTDELEMILAHELAHVRRHDLWINLLQRLAEALLFFHPGLWYISRRISSLREFCCDEMVCHTMTHSGSESRLKYAAALVRVVELAENSLGKRGGLTPAANVAALAASDGSPSELRRRVAHLFGEPISGPLRLSRGSVFATIAVMVALFAITATAIRATEPTAEEVSDKVRETKVGVRTLPSGAEVEVLAIGTQRETPERWWRPDGTPLVSMPFQIQGGSVSPSDDQTIRQLVFRIPELPPDANVTWKVLKMVGGGYWGEVVFDGQESPPGYYSQVFCIAKGQADFGLRIGVATSAWKTMATGGPLGTSIQGIVAGGGIGVAFAEAFSFNEPRFGEGTAAVISHNFVDQDVRVIAVDKAGNRHSSGWTSIRSDGNPQSKLVESKFRGLKPADVDHFEFQTRDFEWVEFAELPAQPNGNRPAVALDLAPPDRKSAALTTRQNSATESGHLFELHVVGPDGKPVPQAVVDIRSDPPLAAEPIQLGQLVRRSNYGLHAKTDDAGRLTLTLPQEPKRFSAGIKVPGFGPYWAGWDSTTVPQPIPVKFTADLDAGWTIGGVIVDAVGVPVADVSINPYVEYKKRPGDFEQLGSGTRLKTDATGKWSFASVPVSKSEVVVEIDHPDFMPMRPTLTRSEFGIEPGREPSAKIVLQRGLTVTGTITDEAGQPIAGALIRAQFMNDIRQATSAENGTYNLVGCEPRMTRVVVSAPGRALDMQYVRVDRGIPPVNFQMKPGGHLRVRVVDEANNPVPKARIFFQDWRGQIDYFEFDHVNGYADENGIWEWNEAPLDEIKADICRPDGMQLDRQLLLARDEEYVFRPPAALVISGTVVDAETKQPVNSFQVVPGLRSSDSRKQWIRNDSYRASAGRYRITRTRGYPAHLVRIEADGYEAAVSREIKSDEGNVTIDFELKRGQNVAATILTPAGAPAAGAKLALGVAGSQINVENGDIDDGSTFAARLNADEAGMFLFPPQDAPYQIVITHPTGYAHIKSTSGPITSPIQLTAWARVEGIFRVGSEPVANVPITINVEDLHSYGTDVPSIFTQHDATTGPNGRFVFERVVPGRARIGRDIILMVDEGATEVTSSAMIPAIFSPGETTHINLGGTGQPVVGKLQPPVDFEGEVFWNFAMINVQADLKQPDSPRPPADIQNDPGRYQAWWKEWLATSAGQAWKVEYAKHENLRSASPFYWVSVAPDGAFRIDDMLPGDYVLSVRFDKHSAGRLADHRFSVPPINDKHITPPFDLGVLTLEKD